MKTCGCILLLLFMALGACTNEQSKNASSPEPSEIDALRTSQRVQALDSIVIRTNDNGQLMVEGEIIPFDSLAASLSVHRKQVGQNSKFVLRVSQQTRYDDFIALQSVIESQVQAEREVMAITRHNKHFDMLSKEQQHQINIETPIIIEERHTNLAPR